MFAPYLRLSALLTGFVVLPTLTFFDCLDWLAELWRYCVVLTVRCLALPAAPPPCEFMLLKLVTRVDWVDDSRFFWLVFCVLAEVRAWWPAVALLACCPLICCF